MENATKALLIAAAVLIAILIISFSLIIYNMASETVGNVNLSEAETTQFNSKFTAFEGDKVPGTQVNALLNTMLTHNQQEAEAGSNRYVKTEAEFAGAITGDSKYINKKAATGKYYTVQCNYTKGLVTTIVIFEKK